MQKIIPSLWFDDQAEEAAQFYVSVFGNSRIGSVTRNGEGGPGPKGSVLLASFELDGQPLIALNGGPQFRFTEAVSFLVRCETQDEVDHFWERLGEGGKEKQCGWLEDRLGLSWQIVPVALMEMMSDPDPEKVRRVTQAMLQMVKLDIATLRLAYEG